MSEVGALVRPQHQEASKPIQLQSPFGLSTKTEAQERR